MWGTSFSAAYVSGVAALVRAKYPNLTAHQVIRRIMQTAHNPAHTVDNQVGYGVVDPVAALTFDVAAGDAKPAEHLSSALHVRRRRRHRISRPRNVALIGAGVVLRCRRLDQRGRGDPPEDAVKARTVTVDSGPRRGGGHRSAGVAAQAILPPGRFGWWPLAVITVLAGVLLLVRVHRRNLATWLAARARWRRRAATPQRSVRRSTSATAARCTGCAPLTTKR